MVSCSDLWAKLSCNNNNNKESWHSLVDHSADVAAVLLELLNQPTINRRLARLARCEMLNETTCQQLAALAFLHDIGKANRGFRARVDTGAENVGHIDQLRWVFENPRYAKRLHEALGLHILTDRWFPDDEESKCVEYLEVIFAHHGKRWIEKVADQERYWKIGADGDPIADLVVMREALHRYFPLAFSQGGMLPKSSGFHHDLAGLITLADWLGSDTTFFPYLNGISVDRWPNAQVHAKEALRAVGLTSPATERRSFTAQKDFAQSFGYVPRPLQESAASPDALCLVLEAETGTGKTEAALWRFKHLFEKGAVDGLYFALPTRAAATAMFKRVRKFRDRIFDVGDCPPVLLAVPGQVMVDEAEGRPLPDFDFCWCDDPNPVQRHARWAAEHGKRFLAAPIAVGTIDQALLSAVQVKHAHMRGALLLRHLLVVDEVHASDAYMEALLRTLLRNHLSAGGHALLLSATLGSVARSRLLGVEIPDLATAKAVPYPALSWAEQGKEVRLIPPPASQEGTPGKEVRVVIAPLIDDAEAIARMAWGAAGSNAAVLMIRNTVSAAVAVAEALERLAGVDHEALFRVGDVATLHHGRFAASDRRLLDDAVECALGRERPMRGKIVVGTQTVEISLDLDADLLITDLCPADVLLQRIGRLHRHAGRMRPPGYETARVVVLTPTGRDLLPFTVRRGGGHGLGSVYDDFRILEATWRMLEASDTLSVPADNRQLVEGTTHPTCLEHVERDLLAKDGAWQRPLNDVLGKGYAATMSAEINALEWSSPFSKFDASKKDERIKTRLGAEDRLVDLPPHLIGPLGGKVKGLRVASWLLNGISTDTEPTKCEATNNGIRFNIGEAILFYDRFGLRKF